MVEKSRIFMNRMHLRASRTSFSDILARSCAKVNDLLRVCEPLRILLLPAALRGFRFLGHFWEWPAGVKRRLFACPCCTDRWFLSTVSLDGFTFISDWPAAAIAAVISVIVIWGYVHSGISILQHMCNKKHVFWVSADWGHHLRKYDFV